MIFGPAVLVLLLVVIVAVVALGASRRTPGAPAPPEAPPASAGTRASPDLDRWVAAGLLSADQADAIRGFEATMPTTTAATVTTAATTAVPAAPLPAGAPLPAPITPLPTVRPARRIPAVAEALGYLGGVLALAGLVLLLARSWSDLGTAGRVAVAGGGSVLLTGAGLAVRGASTDGALARLRGFVWLLAGGAVGVLAAVVLDATSAVDAEPLVVAAVAGAVALHAAALATRGRAPAQEATALVATITAMGAVGAHLGDNGGMGIATGIAGLAALAVGLRGWMPTPWLTAAVGAAGTIVGSLAVASEWEGPGFVLATATALGLMALGLAGRTHPARTPLTRQRFVPAVLGAASLPVVLPSTLGWFARDAGVSTGLVVAAGGVAVLALVERDLVRLPHLLQAAGGLTVVGGLALTGTGSVGLATVAGLLGAVTLVVLGTRPDHVVLSLTGALGLLVNVPWTIAWFFPGEGRTPALIMVTGALIVGVAVLLSRQSGRMRRELRHHHV